MKYKPGDRVKQTRNCSGTLAGRIYTVKYGNVRGDYKDWLYIWDTSTSIWEGGCSCKHKWEPVTNRSKVGKKAYQTFLKNGGSRNSKGQFSNKEKYKIFSNFTIGDKTYYFKPMRGTSIELFDNQIFIKQTDGSYSAITIEKPTEKQKIDWEKIEKDMLEAYMNTPLVIRYNTKEHTKAYAKVFQKHGLIDKGVEI